jgi:hypothetical protein
VSFDTGPLQANVRMQLIGAGGGPPRKGALAGRPCQRSALPPLSCTSLHIATAQQTAKCWEIEFGGHLWLQCDTQLLLHRCIPKPPCAEHTCKRT